MEGRRIERDTDEGRRSREWGGWGGGQELFTEVFVVLEQGAKKAAASRPSSPGALITLNTPAICASINPQATFLYDLEQNSTSAAVAAGHNKYISGSFSSQRCQNPCAKFQPKS